MIPRPIAQAHLWLCLGGPIHGQYRPAGLEMMVPDIGPPTQVTYSSGYGRRTVAVPAAPFLYRPTLVTLAGWRVKLSCWVEDRVARGKAAPPAGAVLPGSVQGERGIGNHVCRWCYGPPMAGQPTCSRVQCITAWDSVRSLDTMTWRGEDR
jgi:hypothetical protein